MSLTIQYCHTCNARIDPADFKAGRAIMYRESWYCEACKSTLGTLDPAHLVQHSGTTVDEEDEQTFSQLFDPSSRSTGARKATRRGSTKRGRGGSRKSTASRAPAESSRQPTSTVRKPKARATANTPTKRAPGRRSSRRGGTEEEPVRQGVPVVLWLIGGIIVALSLVVAVLVAQKLGGTPAGEGSEVARGAGSGSSSTSSSTSSSEGIGSGSSVGSGSSEDPGTGSADGSGSQGESLRDELDRLRAEDERAGQRWKSRLARYRDLAERAAGTPVESLALAQARKIEETLDREAGTQLAALTRAAEALARKGDEQGALARLAAFDPELLTSRWEEQLEIQRARMARLASSATATPTPIKRYRLFDGKGLEHWQVTQPQRWKVAGGVLAGDAGTQRSCRLLRGSTRWQHYAMTVRLRGAKGLVCFYLHYRSNKNSVRHCVRAAEFGDPSEWVRVRMEVKPGLLRVTSQDVPGLAREVRTRTQRGAVGILLPKGGACQLSEVTVELYALAAE